MPKFRTTLKKMSGAEPAYVSLVTRGANRIPFRITKSEENDMGSIDLSGLSRVFKREAPVLNKKSEPEQASILSFVVEKNEDFDAVKSALGEAGFSVEKMEENEDGTVSFKQSDEAVNEDEATVVRLSDSLIAVVKGFQPYCENMKTFAEAVGVENYYSGVDVASRALRQTINKALYDSDDLPTAKKAVTKALADFAGYVTGLIDGLPQAAFKAEKVVGEAVAKCAVAKAEKIEKQGKQEEPAKNETASTEVTGDTPAQKSESGEGTQEGEQGAADVDAKIAKALEGFGAGLLNKVEEAITQKIAPLVDSVNSIEKAAKTATEKAEAVEKTVTTTVAAGAPAGDEPSGTSAVKKEDTDPRSGLFDTAFIRKSERHRRTQ